NEIEMILFVPANSDERDSETQAVFEKDSFYSVGGKIVPGFYEGNKRPKMTVSISTCVTINKVANSNKCPLKISMVGIPQESPRVIANDENAIFNMLINDYAGQEYNFVVKVVFLHLNSRLSHLKTTIRPQESFVFVVGQLEVIDNDFYIYAKDINFINIHLLSKQKVSDNSSTRNSSEVINTTRSKLLSTHRNLVGNTKATSEVETSLIASNEPSDKSESSLLLSKNVFSSNYSESEYFDESADLNGDLHLDEYVKVDGSIQSDGTEEVQTKKRRRKNPGRSGKKR
ncbi:12742_t:CDS:2, partial [Racocetra persica]